MTDTVDIIIIIIISGVRNKFFERNWSGGGLKFMDPSNFLLSKIFIPQSQGVQISEDPLYQLPHYTIHLISNSYLNHRCTKHCDNVGDSCIMHFPCIGMHSSHD